MDGIRFVDTTIRDGHQSLWAENMTTGMMLPVAKPWTAPALTPSS
jgi:pyruvate/oxaloacetate carboxyltransferase